MYIAISAVISVVAIVYRGFSKPEESTVEILAFGLLFFLFWFVWLVEIVKIPTAYDLYSERAVNKL